MADAYCFRISGSSAHSQMGEWPGDCYYERRYDYSLVAELGVTCATPSGLSLHCNAAPRSGSSWCTLMQR